MFEALHDEQANEFALALASVSEHYELPDIAEHVKVPPDTWFECCRNDRDNYIKESI